MLNKRRRIWIDPIQTRLSLRLAAYFLTFQFAVWCLFWIDARIAAVGESQGIPIFHYSYVLTSLAAVTLGLIFIFDALHETHRIFGPLYRFRKTIEAVIAGEEVSMIKLRTGDHLQDLKDKLNEMLRQLESRGAITLANAGTEGRKQPSAA